MPRNLLNFRQVKTQNLTFLSPKSFSNTPLGEDGSSRGYWGYCVGANSAWLWLTASCVMGNGLLFDLQPAKLVCDVSSAVPVW